MVSLIQISKLSTLVTLAVVFAALAPLPAAEVIVDNSDGSPTFTTTQAWVTTSGSNDYGADYLYKLTNDAPSGTAVWKPNLPTAGTYTVSVWYKSNTNRANNAHYTIAYDGGSADVYINQQSNGSQWVTLGSYNFAAGMVGSVTLTSQAQSGKRVVADAVRFYKPEPVQLTMAVNPADKGTTVPTAGTTITYNSGDVVNIQATPIQGYSFKHWTVSAGTGAAAPTSPNTTVTMDVTKTVTAVFVPIQPQFRAFWADAFHAGYKSAAEIDSMVSRAKAGRYNAIIVEVLAFHDNVGTAHGAYWNSAIVPKASDISGGIDPLAYIIEKANAVGIQVHAWIVAYRVSSTWPPSGNSYVASHPEWLTVPIANMGSIGTVGGYYTFDAGSPEVQEYLISIVKELATNYAIDGVHWDYIRYTQTDAGYPTDINYSKSGLARFQQYTGRNDTPSPTGDSQWNDWRRRGINELIARVRAELPLIPSPKQPLRHTASLIPWGDAPSNFSSSSAYGIFQDWEMWMRKGWLDAGCPMLYYREYNASQYNWYRNWVNAALGWRYDRHMYLGQANYLNTMADSITQMQYAYDQGSDGSVNYSYYSTVDSNKDGATENDWAWYNYIGQNYFTSDAPIPSMPWRSPTTATEGTVFGRVVDGTTGASIENAAVQVGALPSVLTDANGYFVVTLVPASGAGSPYIITAAKAGYITANLSDVPVVAGEVVKWDIALTAPPAPPQVATIGDLANFSDNTKVSISNLIVTASIDQAGANYVEAIDRSAGIRAESFVAFKPGRKVSLTGTLGTKPSGERYLSNCTAVSDDLGTPIAALGAYPAKLGKIAEAGNPLTTVGMLMRTWGKITSHVPGSFTINDGSLAGNGLKIDSASSGIPYTDGTMVEVTGIVQLEGTSPTATVLMKPRSANDIKPL